MLVQFYLSTAGRARRAMECKANPPPRVLPAQKRNPSARMRLPTYRQARAWARGGCQGSFLRGTETNRDVHAGPARVARTGFIGQPTDHGRGDRFRRAAYTTPVVGGSCKDPRTSLHPPLPRRAGHRSPIPRGHTCVTKLWRTSKPTITMCGEYGPPTCDSERGPALSLGPAANSLTFIINSGTP